MPQPEAQEPLMEVSPGDGDAPRTEEKEVVEFVLRLYVTGGGPRSVNAIRNVRRLCDEHLKGRVDLSIIDLYQEPWRARHAQIIAAPTLVKELPLPLRRFIGSLSDMNHVLVGLGLEPERRESSL